MRVVIASDKFKGFASAREISERIAAEVRRARPDAEVHVVPVADGGQGTIDALAPFGTQVEIHATESAWREPVTARSLWFDHEAWIETAETAGKGSRSGPDASLDATSLGTGLVLAEVAGARRTVVGIGGTLTSDGGTGLARAFGWRFLQRDGRDIGHGARGLIDLHAIVAPPDLAKSSMVAAYDVAAPLLGPRGTARCYAPQKGADDAAVQVIETGLERLADVVHRELGVDLTGLPGAGAGGGVAAGLAAFLGARLGSGFGLVAVRLGLASTIAGSHLVITGEGSFDDQSLEGKAPVGVLDIALQQGVPCALIAGRITADPWRRGFQAAATLADGLEAAVSEILLRF